MMADKAGEKETKPPRQPDDRGSGGPIIRADTIRDFVKQQREGRG